MSKSHLGFIKLDNVASGAQIVYARVKDIQAVTDKADNEAAKSTVVFTNGSYLLTTLTMDEVFDLIDDVPPAAR